MPLIVVDLFDFQRDQTLVRVIAKHDFGPRHIESVAVMTAVKWGSTL